MGVPTTTGLESIYPSAATYLYTPQPDGHNGLSSATPTLSSSSSPIARPLSSPVPTADAMLSPTALALAQVRTCCPLPPCPLVQEGPNRRF